ncbi:hypothetical protein ABFS82_08G140400 [Erythranthe guttata]|uniref:Uncharacterized protein n=1 Tax=Erythranthe guttata TaxID=4155 RepID=A0A022RWM6_ERYGU|nr:PREDICTED: uncharacterized protein LOC105951455 [Erythranthe guttata]EYU43375.1 hypothetical protein MIMGU_mgv1a015794mg [Erythranthe guttata]|eukprot:XP_012830343.1 PREDICTED: uncharacterized protein LOC105951455 [Erythranthe guttata]
MEGNDVIIANGWPLGLGNMNSRIRVAAAADTSHTAAPPLANPSPILRIRTSSFSSFSSSNIDTESTASFFPDRSVSLGRLIGILPANKGILLYGDEHRRKMPDDRRSNHPAGKEIHENNSRGLCVPLLQHVIGKISRSGGSSRFN